MCSSTSSQQSSLQILSTQTVSTDNANDLEQSDIENLSLEDVMIMMKNKRFPKKMFIFGGVKKLYTPVCHFFYCET